MWGHTELLVIAGIAALLFGAGRLPKIGAGLGEGIRNFRSALRGRDASEDPASSTGLEPGA